MVWLLVPGIFNRFLYINVKIWVLTISYFCKMSDFVNFEAVDDNVDEIDDYEEILPDNASDVEFIDDNV